MTPALGAHDGALGALGPATSLAHVGYADDVTYPLTSPSCRDLLDAPPTASRIIAETWRDGGLQLAPGPAKTAWLLALRGEGSVQARLDTAAAPR
eukprot:2118963-Lingulodinium_polyedra.AAC.1